jgi:membrane protein DedA with SNARE-associated domain
MSNALQWLTEDYALYGYPVLFLGVLLENAAMPVPGETAVLVAGFLSSPAGGGRFQLGLVMLLTALAAMLGDNVGYWLGERFARPRLKEGRRFLFLTPATLHMAEGYFHRWGLWTVVLARFVVGLRVVAALAAGTAGMPWRRFVLANAAGAIAWAVAVSLLGYFFGNSLDLLHRWLGRGGLLLAGALLLLVGLPVVPRHLRHLSAELWPRMDRVRALQGLLLAILEALFLILLLHLGQGHHPTSLDEHVAHWVAAHPWPVVDVLAAAGSFAGSLLSAVVAAGIMLGWGHRLERPRRELAALLAALVASEAVGLLLVGLLHQRHVDPIAARTWPFGFAGLVPLRSVAVFGLAAHLAGRWRPGCGPWAAALAAGLIAWASFGVIWTGSQLVSEVLLEAAAGGLIVVAAGWWLSEFESAEPFAARR